QHSQANAPVAHGLDRRRGNALHHVNQHACLGAKCLAQRPAAITSSQVSFHLPAFIGRKLVVNIGGIGELGQAFHYNYSLVLIPLRFSLYHRSECRHFYSSLVPAVLASLARNSCLARKIRTATLARVNPSVAAISS